MTTTAGGDQALEETIAGLHAVVLLGSFMHAGPHQEDTAELSAGGLAALARVPLAAVAWYPQGPAEPLRLAGRYAGEQGLPAAVAAPLLRLCEELPTSRATRLEGSGLPARLRVAGIEVLWALPLRVSTECLGFLLAGGHAGSLPRDLMLVQALGAQTSTALYVARLQESEAARVSELDTLTGVLRQQREDLARASRFLEGLIDLVLHGKDTGAILEHLASELGTGVWLLDADGHLLARSAREGEGLPREAGLRRALERLRADRVPLPLELTTDEGPRSFLVQTVATDQETYGYLLIGSDALGVLGQAVLQGGRLVLALRLLIDRSVAEAEERAGRDLIHDALVGRGGGRNVAALAARLGYEHDGAAAVLTVGVRPVAGDGNLHPETSRQRAGLAVRDVLAGGIRGIAGPLDEEIVAIVPADGAEVAGRRILERVAAAVPDFRVTVGISDPRPGVGDLESAYREARTALGLAERRSWPVLRFADLGLYRLLFDVEHPERVDEHVERWLGPLFCYDAAHHTQLVETLAGYLTGAGHEEAARALSIHPSTLKYRVRRIREILGFDFAQGEARFNVELALRLDVARRRLQGGAC